MTKKQPSCWGTHGVLGEFRGTRRKATRVSTGAASKSGGADGGEPGGVSGTPHRGYPKFPMPSQDPLRKTRLLRKSSPHQLGFYSPLSREGSGRAGKKENARTWWRSGGDLAGPSVGEGAPQKPLPARMVAPRPVPPSRATHSAELILQEARAKHSASLSGSRIHFLAPRPAPTLGTPSARRVPRGPSSGSGESGAA